MRGAASMRATADVGATAGMRAMRATGVRPGSRAGLSRARLGDFDAVIAEVSGNAFICGFANWTLDGRDPQTHGFLVR